MTASALILDVAVLSGAEEAPESTTLCDPTRAEDWEPAVAVLDGEDVVVSNDVPWAGAALLSAEAWVVVVTEASAGALGSLGVGFKDEVRKLHSLFQSEKL